jgi:hypothetical protein
MRDPKVLTSAALFRALYDNNKDIYDVVSEFIRSTVILNSTWSFNATECTANLYKDFGFQLPDAIVNTCLRSRLVKSGELTVNHGVYSVTKNFEHSSSIQSEYESTKGEYDEILKELVRHVKGRSTILVDESKLRSAFNDFLLYENYTKEYAEYISHFLIANQDNVLFKEKLNRIEEGLVLYTGIRYTSDLSTLGNWSGNLTIFLDTEHLFSAIGYNGILHKRVFDDFFALVKEVNQKNGGRILLRYFSETERDVIDFFYAAEKILENKNQVDPSKTAMLFIINGANSKSEIISRKTIFFDSLNKCRILLDDNSNYYKEVDYNVESQTAIDALKERFNHHTEASKYADILKRFTKINCLRKGVSNTGIDKVAAIFMTENGLTQTVAFSDLVRSNGGIPFATNIEFMTERLWFKLNKGFSGDVSLPVSFDIVTKAKIVFSSQLNNAVSDNFRKLKIEHREGRLTDEQAALLIAELRGKPSNPDDFTENDFDDSIDFIGSKFIEKTLREKSVLEESSRRGEAAVEKLRLYEHDKKIATNKPIKVVARRQYRLAQFLLYILLPIFLIFKLIDSYFQNDTTLSLVFGLCSLASLINPFINLKWINKRLWRLSALFYKQSLKKAKHADTKKLT